MMSNKVHQNTVEADALSSIYSYKELSIDKLRHEYEITVSGAYIKQKVNSRLQKVAKSVKLSGFRVGKTPYGLIATNYTSEVLEYVVNNAISLLK